MRKKIAAFIGEIGREFQKEFIKHLMRVTKERDYDLFIFSNFGSYTSTHLYDSCERDVIKIPNFSEFTGVVTLPDTFDLDGMETVLLRRIKNECSCPVVAVRNGSKQSYRILVDDFQTTYNMTKHFIEDHGFKKICYMSGPHSAADAIERLNGYKAAMADAGLQITEQYVFEGDYWIFRCPMAVDQFIDSFGGAPEAVICGNDYMALGLCDEFKKRGYRILDDVAIAGFDDIIEGQGYEQPLTTVRVPSKEMAIEAVNIIEAVNGGKKVNSDTFLSGSIQLRGSCGCNLCNPGFDITGMSRKLIENYVDVRMAGLIMTDVQNCITEEEKLKLLGSYFDRTGFARSFLCLNTDDNDNDQPFSETMMLRKEFRPFIPSVRNLFNQDNRDVGEFFEEGIVFERREIIPASVYDSDKPVCFVVMPVHHKNKIYGYLASELTEDSDINIFIAPFTSAIGVAYEDLFLQEEYSDFAEIKKQSLIDTLTGILNRRGFEQNLKDMVSTKDLSCEPVSFISADMDNLKFINDNFGHLEGDFALKTVAEVFTSCTSENDIVARTGGDEFWIILTSSNITLHENFIKVVEATLASKCKQLGKEYDIHVSIGSCISYKDNLTDAMECLSLADKRMYEKKRAYKNRSIS